MLQRYQLDTVLLIFVVIALFTCVSCTGDAGTENIQGLEDPMNNEFVQRSVGHAEGTQPSGLQQNGQKKGVQGRTYQSAYQQSNEDHTAGGNFFSPLVRMLRGDYPQMGRMGIQQNEPPTAFGYIQYEADDPYVIFNGYGANHYVDRQVLADITAQIVVGLPGVERVSVLTTDEDCIIGFEGYSEETDLESQVELSGLGVTPRWFKVYVSDDPDINARIQQSGQVHRQHTRTTARESRPYQAMQEDVNEIIDMLGGPKQSWEQPNARMEQSQTDNTEQNESIERPMEQQPFLGPQWR